MKVLSIEKIAITCLFLMGSQFLYGQCNNLLWSDEFNNTTLDINSWNYVSGNGCGGSSGCGFGNNELQYYTSGTNNITLTGGNLIVTAKNQNNYANSGSNYTSGKITTSGKRAFRYGRVEARMKVPSATAIWPAFWLLPENGSWPHTGEIDIMETQNTNTTKVDQTLHFFCTPCGNHQYSGNSNVSAADYAADFHTFAVDWSPGKIEYSVDGVITKTFTPSNAIYPKGGIESDWPYDEGNWYIILNLAVGGSYTGNAVPVAADYPKSLLVDYVRVYATHATITPAITSTLGIIGPGSAYTSNPTLFNASTVASGFSGSGITYNWTVPGGTISSGQGTGVVSISWATSGIKNITLSADLDGSGSCAATVVNYAVNVVNKSCGLVLDDFETNRSISKMSFNNGTYTSPLPNPSKGGSNNSDFVGRYVRNAAITYDLIRIDKFLVGSPANFRTGKVKFTMDVMSTAPAGTPVTIEFNRSSTTGYPQGVHSQYTSVTGPANVWTKLTFNWLASPNVALTDADVDRIQILFNSNSNTNHTYYLDNFIAQAATPVTSVISGHSTNACQAGDVPYSVNANTGATYDWTVPAEATIVSGKGTSTIRVNFGTQNGDVAVTETNLSCTGSHQAKSVSLTGCTATPIVDGAGNQLAEVYPNPFSGTGYIRLNPEVNTEITIQIFDSKGVMVFTSREYPAGGLVPYGKDLPEGLYLLKILNNEVFYTTKIIKVNE